MQKLVCNTCHEEKDEAKFCFNYRHNPPKRRNICTSCVVAKNKEYRHKNREKYNEQARLRRYSRKERAIHYKGGVCEDCKEVVHPSAFDFHHTDASEKDMDPGLMMSFSDEKLFAELDKCILLCSNCHRIRHFNEGY